MVALPLSSALMLPKSPTWRSPVCGLPCGLLSGLKCGPADVASGAEQSPNSWTWNACIPGVNPMISPLISTSSPCCVNQIVPCVLLPLVACRTHTALWTPFIPCLSCCSASAALKKAMGSSKANVTMPSFFIATPFSAENRPGRPCANRVGQRQAYRFTKSPLKLKVCTARAPGYRVLYKNPSGPSGESPGNRCADAVKIAQGFRLTGGGTLNTGMGVGVYGWGATGTVVGTGTAW